MHHSNLLLESRMVNRRVKSYRIELSQTQPLSDPVCTISSISACVRFDFKNLGGIVIFNKPRGVGAAALRVTHRGVDECSSHHTICPISATHKVIKSASIHFSPPVLSSFFRDTFFWWWLDFLHEAVYKFYYKSYKHRHWIGFLKNLVTNLQQEPLPVPALWRHSSIICMNHRDWKQNDFTWRKDTTWMANIRLRLSLNITFNLLILFEIFKFYSLF